MGQVPLVQLPPQVIDDIHIQVTHDTAGKREYQVIAMRQRVSTPGGAPLPNPIEEPFDPFFIMQEGLEALIQLNKNTHALVNQAVGNASKAVGAPPAPEVKPS
jgi:hypothetical protein